MIEDPRGSIDYDESGSGPTIVLVPGSCSTGAAWRPVIARWENRFHCVTTSLLGYGGTAERRSSLDSSIAQETDILEMVIRRAGRPVHLVGHSFGGLCALTVALRKSVPLLSLTILEAPVMELLPRMGEHEHYRAFQDMTDAYFDAYRFGQRDAIARMIDFYGGAGTFAAWPERVRSYAEETTGVNVLDWASAYGFPLTPDALSTVEVPTLVLWGGESHPAMQRANALLAQSIPKALEKVIAGAAHFMISTHPGETAHAIAGHVAWADGAAASAQPAHWARVWQIGRFPAVSAGKG